MPTPMPTPLTTAEPEVITETTPETEPSERAHIVKTEPGQSAAAVVLEARVLGTVIEALCGYRWVPSKDPQRLPICPECASIYEMFRMFNEGLGESPGE